LKRSDTLILLYSHAAPASLPKTRSFCLATISVSAAQLTLEHFARLQYNADPDLRALSAPYLLVSAPATVFVVFAESIVVWTPQFEEVVSLKPGARNRFVGCGLVDGHAVQAATVHSGLLKIEATSR
jgi:hypothetical protein